MIFYSLLRVELLRLLRSRVTWFALLAAAICPLAGYSLFQPAGTGTTAACVLANPLLAGALGGAFIFSALTLFELERIKKGQMEPIINGITSPMMMSVAKTVSLMLTAVLSTLLTSALYLPYTWMRLGTTFQIGEYCKFSLVFLLPTVIIGVLLASAFYQVFCRVDISFVCFTAVMLIGLGVRSKDTYLFYWTDFSNLGFSGDFGNTAIYRMAIYSRTLWLCLFGGAWILSLLCIRNHGKNLFWSFVRNLRKVYLLLLAVVLLIIGTVLFIRQPYMDHEEPVKLDNSKSTGGGMSVTFGNDEEINQELMLHHTEMDLKFDAQHGTLYGEASYQIENESGRSQDCLLETDPGCTIEQVFVNGREVPFTDLQNDYYVLQKNIALTLPADKVMEVRINYKCSPQIPANSGTLMLYNEITREYISIGRNHALPGFQAIREDDCTFSGQVTLPLGMELIAGGETPQIMRENADGTATWSIHGEEARTSFFAGDYIRVLIPGVEFPAYFCYGKAHQKEFEQLDIQTLLTDKLSYCTKQYGSLPYTEEYPLNIVMTSTGNLSYMGETFFTAANLNDLLKGGSAAEVIVHEIIHQWWGIHGFLMDTENTDWSSEALTCYSTYRMMKDLRGEAYAKEFYVDVWQEKYDNMMDNFYLRNPALAGRIQPAIIYALMPIALLMGILPLPCLADFYGAEILTSYPALLKVLDPVFQIPSSAVLFRLILAFIGLALIVNAVFIKERR